VNVVYYAKHNCAYALVGGVEGWVTIRCGDWAMLGWPVMVRDDVEIVW